MDPNYSSNVWIWNNEYQRYYRMVLNSQGLSVLEWAQDNAVPQTTTTNMANASLSGYQYPLTTQAYSDAQNTLSPPPATRTLHSGYWVREGRDAHNFFVQGRVFATNWSEAASATLRRTPTDNSAITYDMYGEGVYTQIRRFVVVKVNRAKHFVYACAISTYGNQGTLKSGCNAAEHTIVYLKNKQPVYFKGEWEKGMRKEPIQIDPTNPNEEMTPASRLRLGRIYSMEWNHKVKDIGKVSQTDLSKLIKYYKEESETGFDPDVDDDAPPSHQAQPTYTNNSYGGQYYHPQN